MVAANRDSLIDRWNTNKCDNMNKASDPMNASKMCRLCLVDGPEEDMVEIFDSNEVSLTVRILACAGLDVCSM